MTDSTDGTSKSVPERGGISRLCRGCFILLAAVFLISMLVAVALVGFVIAGVATGAATAPKDSGPVRLREVRLSGPARAPKIAVINIEGIIYGSATPSAQLTPVAVISAKLERARRDPDVRGVLLFVESGGGGITGADILHNRIKGLGDAPDPKPVVACILNVGASGAYYGICGADKIIAHPTSLTGSIGVLMPLFDATGLMEKIGIREQSIRSGDFKDTGSPFSDQPEDVKQRQRELLEGIVESMHERFVETVVSSRGLSAGEAAMFADGRILTAAEALEAGLIDDIGYEQDAIDALGRLTGVDSPRVVQYRRDVSLGSLMRALLGLHGQGARLSLPFQFGDMQPVPRPMYYFPGGESAVTE